MYPSVFQFKEGSDSKMLVSESPERIANLQELIIRPIDDGYAIASYLGLEVTMMKINGYINATHLCQQVGKEFKSWLKNQTSKSLIIAVENKLKSQGINDPAIIVQLTGARQQMGSYVHGYLLPHISCWASADFSIKVSEILNAIAINDIQKKLGKSQNRIADLEVRLNKIINEKDILTDEFREKLNFVTEDRVLKVSDVLKTEAFIVIKTNVQEKEYYMIRRQYKEMNSKMEELRKKFPNFDLIVYLQYQPNSSNFGNLVVEKLGSVITRRGNYIVLSDQISEEIFIKAINDLHESRKDVNYV